MKKKIATAMMTLATACGFAQDATPQPTLSSEKLPTAIEVTLVPAKEQPIKSFFYVRAEVVPMEAVGAIPGIGWGYRLVSNSSAIDFSSSYKERRQSDSEGKIWTFPKINYFYYLTPQGEGSIYLGGGVAFGGVRKDVDDGVDSRFEGLIANASAGYEMNRSDRFRTFVQLDVNQPTVAAHNSGAFPGPSAEFSLGAGF